MSGTGKSSALTELARRGFRTVDTDEPGWCGSSRSAAARGTLASVQAMPDLWTPVAELPHEAFVERLHKAIATFAEATGVEKPLVEVELADTSRFVLERIDPEPGFGMVTLYVTDTRDDTPDALIIPIGSLRRIELRKSPEERVQRFGFSVPPAT